MLSKPANLGSAKIMGHHRIKAPMMRKDKNSEFTEVLL